MQTANNEALSSRLRHVYWIGCGSGAGKTTIAKRLADQYCLRLYSADEKIRDHGRRTPPEERPFVCAFDEMDMEERWVNRPPETMLETFHFFRGECFDRIVEDLLEYPPDRRVIAEGFRLLPDLVDPLLDVTTKAFGSFRRPNSVWRRSKAEGRYGTSPGRPATLNARCKTCWCVMGCLPIASGNRPKELASRSLRSTFP
jgi:hypothetical protein